MMSSTTKIEWTDATWNPVTGCKHGCKYCYARTMARRLKGMGQHKYRNEFEPTFHPEELSRPDGWKKPRRIFTCSMADLFGDWVPNQWIRDVIEVVRSNKRHTFQFLTKNPERYRHFGDGALGWLRNAWLGATVTDQASLRRALMYFWEADATVRYLSVEPMLGPVALPYDHGVQWVIIGRLTGPARIRTPFDPQWVLDLTEQAREMGIPVFHKDNLGELATLKEFPS